MSTKTPILITGVPRSGASMIAGAFALCGAVTGHVNKMNENPAIIRIHQDVLRKRGADDRGQYPFPISEAPVNGWKECVLKAFLSAGGSEVGIPMIKDSRIALLWQTYQAAFPEARWVIIRRSDADIYASCMKTAYLDAFNNKGVLDYLGFATPSQGWKWWIEQYQSRLRDIASHVRYLSTVWPERMVYDDYTELKETVQWLGLEWNPDVVDYMNLKLRKSKERRIENGK